MTYIADHIAKSLKETRQNKGLSQRKLSDKAGVPQSHISKIESGAVDLRLSSLISLARVLDLEVELVPKKTLPAVKSIVRSNARIDPDIFLQKAKQSLADIESNFMRATKVLPNSQVKTSLQQLQSALEQVRPGEKILNDLKKLNVRFDDVGGAVDLQQELDKLNAGVKKMRIDMLMSKNPSPAQKFAYRLEGSDDE